MSDTGAARIAAGRNRCGIGRKTTPNNTTTTALPTTTGIGAAGKRPPTSMPIAEGQEQRGRGELDEPLGKVLARDRPAQDGERVGGDHAECGADPQSPDLRGHRPAHRGGGDRRR
ncbi:hypothetical protein [Mycobacterium sp.]|uniref:hypothetical protein n=1 Tax=Mycobacterium sp. TaxID=1785 RepID=UPI003BEEC123